MTKSVVRNLPFDIQLYGTRLWVLITTKSGSASMVSRRKNAISIKPSPHKRGVRWRPLWTPNNRPRSNHFGHDIRRLLIATAAASMLYRLKPFRFYMSRPKAIRICIIRIVETVVLVLGN